MPTWNNLDLGGVDAYAAAVKAGYTGTRQQWMTAMQNAEANGLKSEGYATGKQNGTPVSSGTYYQDNAKYYKEQAAGSATAASESATAAAGSASSAAASAADALNHTQSVIETWLGNNITEPEYPLDRTLALSNAAAPADMVGSAIEQAATGMTINVSSATSVVTNVPIIAGIPYVFDLSVSNGGTTAFVDGYSSDTVTLLNGVVGKTFQNSGYLKLYIISQRTITGKVYIDGTSFKLNLAHPVNVPAINTIAIKTKKANESIYNTNRQFNTTGLTIDNISSHISSATYQYTFDPIRIRNSDGSLVYNNLHIENLATLQNDQQCCYTFDKYGAYLRTVMFNTMVSRNPVFASDEYFAALIEFPNTSSMANMKWVVDDVNVEWIRNSTEINEIMSKLYGNSFSASAASGSTTTSMYIESGVEYTFETTADRSVTLFVEGYTSDSITVKSGLSLNKYTFENSGYLRCYASSAYNITGKAYVALNQYEQEKNVYHVGTGKDFSTFTAMLIALENDDREKTVYVDSGVYDIFEEMGGAEYIATITNPGSKNWRDVCHVVPQNTTIIGLGTVILKWEPDAAVIGSRDMAYLFSPLNISGSCRIENITVKCKNGRYCIHDEGSGTSAYDNTRHEFINVKAEYLANSTYGNTNAYGSGHNKGMELIFENCEFISQNGAWATHDNIMTGMGAYDSATIILNNCVFKNRAEGYCVRFYSSDTDGKKDIVKMNNCYFENGYMYFQCPSSGSYKQGYDVTLIGCTETEVRYDAGITDYSAPNQYNAQ